MAEYNPQVATPSRVVSTDASGNLQASSTLPLGYAELWSSGNPTYYATINLAQTAAASGNTIVVHGVLNERGIGKNGVTFHFPTPNDGITYTGTSGAIFTDGGSAMTFSVTGLGSFRHSGASGTMDVVHLSHASSDVRFFASYTKSDGGSIVNQTTTGKVAVNIVKADGKTFGFINNGTMYATVGELLCTSSGVGFTNANAGVLYATVDTYQGEYSFVENTGSTSVAYVRAKKARTTSSFANELKQSGAGEMYLFIDDFSTAGDIGFVSDGTLHVLGGHYKTTGSNKHGFVLSSTQTTKLYSGTTIIANGTGKSVYAASAEDVIIHGHVVANANVDANITTRVGTFSYDTTYIT